MGQALSDVTPITPAEDYSGAAWDAICRSQAVIEFDLDGTILWANPSFLALVGYRLDEIAGRQHRMLCSPDYAASPAYAAFWEKLRSGQFDHGIYPRLRKDGRELWLQATYNPVLRNGVPHRVLKIATDVTDRVDLERELQQRGQTLRNTITNLSEVVRVISGFAHQTSLLSLNARIEAARAGDAGRTFGIVADEVKKLADDVHLAAGHAIEMARLAPEPTATPK